ncbi:hypothetical protein B0H13DRAFT_1591482, partial [Mycena leptocephala]
RHSPLGIIWDAQNYSCAYYALFTIFTNIWLDNNLAWSGYFMQSSRLLGAFSMDL